MKEFEKWFKKAEKDLLKQTNQIKTHSLLKNSLLPT